MREMTRREVCVGLPALAALGTTVSAQTPAAVAGALAESRVYVVEEMPVRTNANGGKSRDVLHGALATGEVVAVHESEQPAGAVPNPPHRIQHSEVIVVREGTLEFLLDGKVERAGAGDVIYVAPGTLHTAKNVGAGPAKYVVVAIGGDVKR